MRRKKERSKQGQTTCTVLKAGHPGVPSCSMYMYVCLSGLWLGGSLHLSFLSDFLKLVCYAHVFPCILACKAENLKI